MLIDKNRKISNSLKKKFLYENDINSIHILINLYETEDDIINIFPKYLSLGQLRKTIRQNLRGRKGNDLASKNISELIHNDFNRLELLLYLEGYKKGYSTKSYANSIEEIILESSEIEEIYSKQKIRESIKNNPKINLLKQEILNKLKNDLYKNYSYRKLIYSFNKKIIKKKLFQINKYIDKQLKLEEDINGKTIIKFESPMFSRKELANLYKNLVILIYDDGIEVLLDAYWTGLIEKVLRRYK